MISAIFVGHLKRQRVQILEPPLCEEHEDAVNEEAVRNMFRNIQCRVFREQLTAILTAMRAVYWLTKEDIGTVKYGSLLNFLDEVGLRSVKNVRVGRNEE